MEKQELQAMLQGSGLFSRMQKDGIDRVTIELGSNADFNVELYRKSGTGSKMNQYRNINQTKPLTENKTHTPNDNEMKIRF